jgi:hypothetical protein
MFISNISSESAGIVTVLENTLHGLETGDVVVFSELTGMTELLIGMYTHRYACLLACFRLCVHSFGVNLFCVCNHCISPICLS